MYNIRNSWKRQRYFNWTFCNKLNSSAEFFHEHSSAEQMIFCPESTLKIFLKYLVPYRGVIREILLCPAATSQPRQACEPQLSQKYNARVCPSKVSNSATLNFLNVRWGLARLQIWIIQSRVFPFIDYHNWFKLKNGIHFGFNFESNFDSVPFV